MNFAGKPHNTFKHLVARVVFLAFEVIGGVVSFLWAMVMFFSAFIAAAVGTAFAQAKVVPYLGLSAGWLATGIRFVVSFLGSLVAVVVVEVLELILLSSSLVPSPTS